MYVCMYVRMYECITRFLISLEPIGLFILYNPAVNDIDWSISCTSRK